MDFFHCNVCNRLYSFFRYCKMLHVLEYMFVEIYMEFHFNKWNVITTTLTRACIRKFPNFFSFGN